MTSNIININVKFILTGIFALVSCFFLHAEETGNSGIYYGNAEVVGKEYIHEEATPEKKESAPQEQNAQAEIYSSDSSCIYIADNAEVYGKELLFAQQNTSSKDVKKATGIKKETPAPVENEIIKQEPITVVFPTLPFESSSFSFSEGGNETAVIYPQQRIGGYEQTGKACWGNACTDIKNSDLPIYYPNQRQKLSITATQCGMLSSFGAQSPPEEIF